MSQLKVKQIRFPDGAATDAVTDGQTLTGSEAASLVAGVDENGDAQFISTDDTGAINVTVTNPTSGTVDVSNFPSVQPVSGNVGITGSVNTRALVSGTDSVTTVPSGTQAISAAAAIPVSDNGGSLTVDGSVAITGTPTVAISGTVPVTGAVSATITGTPTVTVGNASIPVTASSLPLPSNAATETTLASVLTAIQTGGGASSVTVTSSALPTGAATQTTLAAVLSQLSSGIPVTGSVNTRALASGTDSVTIVPSGTQTVSGSVSVTGSVNTRALTSADVVTIVPSGTQAVSLASTTISNFPTTQPVSGSVTATISGTPTVAISGTVPVSASALPLPAGAATETTLATISTKTPALGQATMANSSPVVLASNQSAVPVSASALPLPSGAATETTLGTLLTQSAFQTRVNTLGQKAMTASTPVVLASDQSSIPVAATIQGTPTVTFSNTSITVNGSTTANQGTPNSTSQAWPLKIVDGGLAVAKVLAASTAPVAADPALNVAISPNSTVAITSATLAQDATLTGGTQKAIARGGAKGTTTAADVTSTAAGANHQALDVIIVDSTTGAPASLGGGTQYADAAAVATPTGTQTMLWDGANARAQKGDSNGLAYALPAEVSGAVNFTSSTTSTIPVPTNGGFANLRWALSGTFSGNVSIQGSLNGGTTWYTLPMRLMTGLALTSGSTVTFTGTVGHYITPVAGWPMLRINGTWSSGTMTVNWRLFSAPISDNATPAMVQLTDASTNQVGASTSSPFFTTIANGGAAAAVKGSATAQTTDSSLVVQLSPNGVINPDQTNIATMGSLNAAATVLLASRTSAGFYLTTANLSATVVPEICWDDQSNLWFASYFVDNTGQYSSSLVFTGSVTQASRAIVVPAGATRVRARISAYTSGTSTGRLNGTSVVSPTALRNCLAGSRLTISGTTSSQQLVAANVLRTSVFITNTAAATLYVNLGGTASSTDFDFQVAAGAAQQFNLGDVGSGIINGALASGTGNILCKEVS